MIIARLQEAKDLVDAGLYKWRAARAYLLDFLARLSLLAALAPGMLPDALQPYHHTFLQVGLWSLAISWVCTNILAQTTQKVLPKAPTEMTPSLTDDETAGFR